MGNWHIYSYFKYFKHLSPILQYTKHWTSLNIRKRGKEDHFLNKFIKELFPTRGGLPYSHCKLNNKINSYREGRHHSLWSCLPNISFVQVWGHPRVPNLKNAKTREEKQLENWWDKTDEVWPRRRRTTSQQNSLEILLISIWNYRHAFYKSDSPQTQEGKILRKKNNEIKC